MTPERTHRCGGTLVAQQVSVQDEADGMVLMYRVPGLVCNSCGDELIERDVLVALEKSQVPTIVWNAPAGSQLSGAEILSGPDWPDR